MGGLISSEQILTLSFKHFIKKKTKIAIWGTSMALFFIFKHKEASTTDMMDFVLKELFWHQNLERWWCGRQLMTDFSDELKRMQTGLNRILP